VRKRGENRNTFIIEENTTYSRLFKPIPREVWALIDFLATPRGCCATSYGCSGLTFNLNWTTLRWFLFVYMVGRIRASSVLLKDKEGDSTYASCQSNLVVDARNGFMVSITASGRLPPPAKGLSW